MSQSVNNPQAMIYVHFNTFKRCQIQLNTSHLTALHLILYSHNLPMINISLILVEKHKDIQHGSNALDWDSYIRELAQWPLVRDSSNSFDAEAAIALIQKAVESSNYAISSCFGPKGWWKRESRGMSPSSGLGKSGFLAICIVSQFGRTAPRPLVRESHASLQWFSM
jgi:hypothetical protein